MSLRRNTVPGRSGLLCLGVAALLLAACQDTPDTPPDTADVMPPEPPFVALMGQADRPLPIIGSIPATYDGVPVLWQTLDFSLGAIDPSANMSRYDGTVSFYMSGHLPGQDFREHYGRLRIEAELPAGPVPGLGNVIEIAVIDVPGYDAPRYVGGADARLEITSVALPTDEFSVFGQVSGNFSGTLCRAESQTATPDPDDCKTIEGTFETEASFESLR